MNSLIKLDFLRYWYKPINISVLIVFWILMWSIFWIFEEYNLLIAGYADLLTVFQMLPNLLLFMIPAFALNMISEDFNENMLNMLKTKTSHIDNWVISKYMSGFILISIFLMPLSMWLLPIQLLTGERGRIDMGIFFSGFLGLNLLSWVWFSISLLFARIIRQTMASFLVSVLINYLLHFGIASISNLPFVFGHFDYMLMQISTQYHYDNFVSGVVHLESVVYLLTIITCTLFILIHHIKKNR